MSNCSNNGVGGNWIWIIILLFLCGGCGNNWLAAQTQTTVTAHGLSSLSFFSAAAETITATAAVCAKHNEKKLYLHKQIQL